MPGAEVERQRSWNTAAVRPAEQFSYYREAICQAFMNLTPEPARGTGFAAEVQHVSLGSGAINRVAFPEHTVRRSRTDIAASGQRCFYLNLKLAGRCTILQDEHEVSLSAGQVGIFDSDRTFVLQHDRGPSLGVISFRVPSDALFGRLPAATDIAPARLSDDPCLGALIVETARSLNANVLRLAPDQATALFSVLLDLVALSVSRSREAHATASFADATTLALRRAIHERLREPGLTVATIAASVGISERYVHKLLARAGTSFSEIVMARRLDGVARDLRDPACAGHDIGRIAFDWGFSDLSHFSRRFKQRFGLRPRDWRAQAADSSG
ncbi:putative transcriptional regulatory protein, AraC/XylS family [Bradyrhizobium sp. ORS 285]|uniref:helix-turn-helix domain-containing protein n=1 Tax=Bradyrhizobium sp. ORS 285 TaxID=115808 RepID=UPI00024083EF|nr:helix-turn-helix domain-containing protein [Bradyrhizobium sp. ORS 285]CCD85636.1 putative transcriptional regulatory protein, AraC/XylS family [Bradyrhizobium sp. ORS 285]SMX58950.1 putative transcriptional regulatory protein, AraC/XylS family [Bradyrhizobium sp. ORS 285]